MRAVMLTAVKGGVGVSTSALMLAKALAEQRSNVTLVDMDVAGYISSILGDGMRFFDDVEKLRHNPDQLTKLVAEYTAVATTSLLTSPRAFSI